MTKVKIIKPFVDKYNLSRAYCPGEEVLFDVERAARLIRLGLGENAEPTDVPGSEDAKSELKPEPTDVPDSEEEVLPADKPSVPEESEEKPKRKPRSKK